MELLPLATAALLGNVDVSDQVVLSLTGNFERNTVPYQCEGLDQPLAVDFINAAPNFLALVPIGPQKLVFVATLSADGVKYVSGQYEFWTKGSDATLADLQSSDNTPHPCTEITDTP